MAPQPGPRSLLISVAVLLLLAGCGTWWQQQQRAARERLARELCRNTSAQISRRLAPITADQLALQRLSQERYIPTAAPAPPDPERSSRFSQLDRELDDERFQQQRAAWQDLEQQRRARWEQNQQQRRERVEQQLEGHLQQLAAINPRLVVGTSTNQAEIKRLSSCDG